MSEIYDVHAEQMALGAIIAQPTAEKSRRIAETLDARDFYVPRHRRIFECLLDLARKGKPADDVTIPAWFAKVDGHGNVQGNEDQYGGALGLIEIVDSVPSWHNAAYYAENASRLGFLRRLREAAQKVARDVVTSGKEPSQVYADAMACFSGCKPRGSDMLSLADVKDFGKPEGVETHLPSLNAVSGCGGLPKGQVSVIGARKKVGKTSNLVSMARKAVTNGKVAGYYTIADLMVPGIKQRLVQQMTGWDKRPYSLQESVKYDQAIAESDLWDLMMRDVLSGATEKVEALCVQIDQDHDRYGFDLVCVDYAQKLESSSENDRVRAQEKASKSMAKLAATCGFALAIGSQLSKDGQTRYSQEWEDDAGLVVHFSREQDSAAVEVDVPYNRFGPSRSFDATWDSYRLEVRE